MVYRRMRGLVMASSVAATLLAVPAESKACAFLDCLFGGGARTTYRAAYVPQTYAAAYAPSASVTCAPQTCRYVPQTGYRTVYRRVPVTTCQATTHWSFWSGGPVTTYRPVTSWTRQATLIPYTTYRLVYSNPCNPCGTYYGSYAGMGWGVPSSGCAPCAPGTVILQSGAASLQPALNGVPDSKTFQKTEKPAEKEPLVPIPKANGTQLNSAPAPTIIAPKNRTTWRAVTQATHYRLIASPPRPATAPEAQTEIGVWRASRD